MSLPFVTAGAIMARRKVSFKRLYLYGLIFIGILITLAESYHAEGPPWIQDRVMTLGLFPMAIGLTGLAIQGNLNFRSIAYLGQFSLGIYLIHPWIIEVLRWMSCPFTGLFKIPFLMAAISLSLLITLAITRVPYLRTTVN